MLYLEVYVWFYCILCVRQIWMTVSSRHTESRQWVISSGCSLRRMRLDKRNIRPAQKGENGLDNRPEDPRSFLSTPELDARSICSGRSTSHSHRWCLIMWQADMVSILTCDILMLGQEPSVSLYNANGCHRSSAVCKYLDGGIIYVLLIKMRWKCKTVTFNLRVFKSILSDPCWNYIPSILSPPILGDQIGKL